MNAEITIRSEVGPDEDEITDVVSRAYEHVSYSDHTEHLMVLRLRSSSSFVPELSLVAECRPKLVGHMLLTKVSIRDADRAIQSLALAPLSVVPSFQRRGVGTALVADAHQRARDLGFRSVILLGSPEYYSRFGYLPLHPFDIDVPFAIRRENCMALSLEQNGLVNVQGIVDYPVEWTLR